MRDIPEPIEMALLAGLAWWLLRPGGAAAAAPQAFYYETADDPAHAFVMDEYGAAAYDELGAGLSYDVAAEPDYSAAALDDLEAGAWGSPPLSEWGAFLQMSTIGNDTNFQVNAYPTYAALIAQTETTYGIPRDLLARLLWKESRYRPEIIDGSVLSAVGAKGIAQFMTRTARDYGLIIGNVDHRGDPARAIPAAGKYLKALHRSFNHWGHAVAAYNWGMGNMRKFLNGSIATMPAETRDYIAAIVPPSGTTYA